MIPPYHWEQAMSLDGGGFRSGAGEGTRTPDPRITNALLYQLSYTGPLRVRVL
jgi:hypothetical protein